jgi:uncharacterized protein YgiM (DUF1202 family)
LRIALELRGGFRYKTAPILDFETVSLARSEDAMRGLLALICCCLLETLAAADDDFPYSATVSDQSVEVRCGPGWEYYATDVLRQGQRVEVYRHEPGGWLAIRPPEGSHSWVPARQLESVGQDVARVIIDGAVAWVGSSAESVRQHKWQIRLDRDELVAVLDKVTMSAGPGFAKETYCKIAPPPGEFRWIHAEHAAAPQSIAHRSAKRKLKLVDFRPGSTAPKQPPRRAVSSEELAELSKQLKQVNVELALLVTRDISQWNLDALQDRATQLVTAARETKYEDEVREIAERVEQFKSLRRRYEQLGDMDRVPVGDRSDGVSAAPREIADEPIGTGIIPASTGTSEDYFSDVGWLMPVHSTKRIAPPYALLDDNGQVKCYITPSPGLNLRRYLREHVSVHGQQRSIASLRAKLVTAQRVSKARK